MINIKHSLCLLSFLSLVPGGFGSSQEQTQNDTFRKNMNQLKALHSDLMKKTFYVQKDLEKIQSELDLTYVTPWACLIENPQDYYKDLALSEDQFKNRFPNATPVKLKKPTHFFDLPHMRLPSKIDYVRQQDGHFIPIALFISQFNHENNCACWLSSSANSHLLFLHDSSEKAIDPLCSKLCNLELYQTAPANKSSNETVLESYQKQQHDELRLENPVNWDEKGHFYSFNTEVTPDTIVLLGRDAKGNFVTQTVQEFCETYKGFLSQTADGALNARFANREELFRFETTLVEASFFNPIAAE